MSTQALDREVYLPRRRLWTVKEYDRAARLGLFRPDERLELIEGEVVEKVSPQASPHATAVRAVEVALGRSFPSGYDVRCQLPLVLGTRSEPEPDAAVVVGSFRDYAHKHPTTAVMVVEVSDSTLRLDRTTKAAIYARSKIPEYWIINLADRTLEVHRDPGDGDYREIKVFSEFTSISPLANPDVAIAVLELLP